MIRTLKMAAVAAGLLALTACATATPPPPPPPPPPAPAPAPPPPPPPPPPAPAPRAAAPAPAAAGGVAAAGQTIFMTRCSGCHTGSGRAPSPDTLKGMDPNAIVAALTTGAMVRQGMGLTADDKKAVATYLTGKSPT